MVLYSIWLQLRARQDFLGSTLLRGPVNKENKITYVPAKNFKKIAPSALALFLPGHPYNLLNSRFLNTVHESTTNSLTNQRERRIGN